MRATDLSASNKPLIHSVIMCANQTASPEATAPVRFLDSDNPSNPLEAGVALCLSGGGYRAMLFHVGALWRLNEAGLLKKLHRVSSVSGGSIVAGMLGIKWQRLSWDAQGHATRLEDEVVRPIRALAERTLDAEAVIVGILTPGTISQKVEAAYDEYLYHGASLQDLPADADGPRFVINATNVQTGALWRFSRPYMADYLVGRVPNPKLSVALAVAASSAFPPVLSPATLDLQPSDFVPDAACPLQREPFTSRVILTDGGVYDNLGLETAWKRYRTVLVSDGGGQMGPEAEPKHDWARHAYRVLNLIDNQVRNLRKRQLLEALLNPDDAHDGGYWGIRADIGRYPISDALPCPPAKTSELAATPTRLKRIDPELQERIINWGYAVCDATLRAHCVEPLKAYGVDVQQQPRFPYPRGI
jgi:NTE family protein